MERWIGELSRDLGEGIYEAETGAAGADPEESSRGSSVPWAYRACRDRVAQTSAMLVLGPIFEADLQPEQYAIPAGTKRERTRCRRIHTSAVSGPPRGG